MMLTGSLSKVGNITGTLSAQQGFSGDLSLKVLIKTQAKTVTPSAETQTIIADDGYAGLSSVTVSPIPDNYGLITYNGSYILVS